MAGVRPQEGMEARQKGKSGVLRRKEGTHRRRRVVQAPAGEGVQGREGGTGRAKHVSEGKHVVLQGGQSEAALVLSPRLDRRHRLLAAGAELDAVLGLDVLDEGPGGEHLLLAVAAAQHNRL